MPVANYSKYTKNKHLSKVPSKLLAQVAEDIIYVSEDKRIYFDMSEWVYDNGNECAVCLAGACMLRRVNPKHLNIKCLQSFSTFAKPLPRTGLILRAINYYRQGSYYNFFSLLGYNNISQEVYDYLYLNASKIYMRADKEEVAKFAENLLK